MSEELRKKGQVAIFVILGLIIVVIIAIFLLLKINSGPKVIVIDENNPEAFIETCTREAAEDAITRLSIHGGDIVPEGSVNYLGQQRVYLCKSFDFYMPCTYQRPLLVEHIEKQVTNYITPVVVNCFEKLKSKLIERYNVTDVSGIKMSTRLFPKHVGINIQKEFRIIREDRVISFDDFNVRLQHPIYELSQISMEIANQQAKYCYFDPVGFMIFNPDFDINQTITGDADQIYNVKERATGQNFTFAIRSCPLPPGY